MHVLFFAVCGPKFTKFGMHVGEWLQFPTPFSGRWYLVPVRRYSRSNREIRNFDVFGPPNFLGGEGPPNFWLDFINYSHHRTCGKIWWRKKIKRIETSAVKYNGRRPASWRAAIMKQTNYLLSDEILQRHVTSYTLHSAHLVWHYHHLMWPKDIPDPNTETARISSPKRLLRVERDVKLYSFVHSDTWQQEVSGFPITVVRIFSVAWITRTITRWTVEWSKEQVRRLSQKMTSEREMF